jgi:hypothetical protein
MIVTIGWQMASGIWDIWISPRMGWVYPRWWAEIARGEMGFGIWVWFSLL